MQRFDKTVRLKNRLAILHFFIILLFSWFSSAYAEELNLQRNHLIVDNDPSRAVLPKLNLSFNDTELLTGKVLYADLPVQQLSPIVKDQVEQLEREAWELHNVGLYELAFPLYMAAAEQGSATAQAEVAHSYFHGYGVAQNHQQAAFWYEKAAAQGDAYSQEKLCLLFDDGLTQDQQQVRYWCERAALQGVTQAKNKLKLWKQ
ncbi:tetratricopeptide repeat protein [Alkanindiges illinoisensis]|uniref:tetratricopeptide repeat protein n=1 Tax=Alkanindiges illinoisensis TaxID=197183 RepID=UPI000687D422|nr:tetratricopeptide repeat protein [Alkanindiges illinoisensis]